MTPGARAQAGELLKAIDNEDENRNESDSDDSTLDLIAQAIQAAVEAEQIKCIDDVCMYCGKRPRALGYGPAVGPNSAGNYTHKDKSHGGEVLCKASSIWARIRYAAAIRQEGDPS